MVASKNDTLILKIADKLRLIPAHELQALAEDMAIIAFPARFADRSMTRQGRNIFAQTTKGWPDAFVDTYLNTVDGIEATRDQNNWEKHLEEDLKKAKDPKHPNLSGYFFVGGNPNVEPAAKEIKYWKDEFEKCGIPLSKINLFIGKHLAMELAASKYARIRQEYLGLPSQCIYFESSDQAWTASREMGLFHPGKSDFVDGNVYQPSVKETIATQLITDRCSYVVGYGACGKTTLAQSLSFDTRFALSPSYMLDLARLSTSVTNGELMNEMLALSGDKVLFTIDNTHVDERRTLSLFDYWTEFCKPTGARILLMGRYASVAKLPNLRTLRAQLLCVSDVDLRGIVECLFKHHKQPFNGVPKDDIRQWLETFGGSRISISKKGVDLVAFSAAVSKRTDELLQQDWRLSSSDAISAVRERYIERIQNTEDLNNLIRIAALYEYEIPVPILALPHPGRGFSTLRQLGLVLESQNNLSLIHSAIGPLLLAAAGYIDIETERMEAATASPPLCAKMVLMLKRSPTEEKEKLQETLALALSDGAWLKRCTNLNDVVTTLAHGLHTKVITIPTVVAQLIKSSKLIEFSLSSRRLEAITSFVSKCRTLGLSEVANEILSELCNARWKEFQSSLLYADASEKIGFLRRLSRPEDVLKKIDRKKWDSSWAKGGFEVASSISQLCRYLELKGAIDLTRAPARRFLEKIQISALHNSDLGDISNIVRFADVAESVLEEFFVKLQEFGWLDDAYASTRQGQLCGALMSFNNTLTPLLRTRIYTRAINDRIRLELDIPNSPGHRVVARQVCLLGIIAALWPNQISISNWKWPDGASIANVFDSYAPNNMANNEPIGMYELQFWGGIMWLSSENLNIPRDVPSQIGDDFLRKLRNTPAPTLFASKYKETLLSWGVGCQDNGWKI